MNDYYFTHEPIPEGFTLFRGKLLATAVRGIIPFRLAYEKKVRSRDIPVGLLILTTDLPKMQEAVDRREARREHEKKHCNLTKRS